MPKLLIVTTPIPLPAPAYGAVEAIVWEHYQRIPKISDWDVEYLNSGNIFDLNWDINKFNKEKGPFDFVHFHYDVHHINARALSASFPGAVALTSHFPFLFEKHKWKMFGWDKIINNMVDDGNPTMNFYLSEKGKELYLNEGSSPSKLFRLKNGADEKIKFTLEPKFDKTICLGKICPRKGQEHLARLLLNSNIEVDYVGPNLPEEYASNLNVLGDNYKGEYTRARLSECLTDYTNSVLLSTGETLFTMTLMESLLASLGLVISENCVSDVIDTSLPFITVIPNDKLSDSNYVRNAILENKEISRTMRAEIRQYAIDNFAWDNCLKEYIQEVERALYK